MPIRFDRWQWGLSGAPLLLMALGLLGNDRHWLWAFAVAATISLFAWIAAFRRGKAIADTPTSSIASAAQGYVELLGHASNKPEYHLVAKSGLTCVWYSWVSYRRDNDNTWQEYDRQTSDSIFELSDARGHACLVNPEGAEVISNHRRSWHQDGMKYVEDLLIPGQPLYLLGEFTTLSPESDTGNMAAEVSHLLRSWKQDHAGLLEHFDRNRDGKIDLQEWEAVRRVAHRQVMEQNRYFQRQPGIHLVSRPKDRRLFLISNLAPQQLRLRYLMWSWLHLLMFFATLVGGLKLALLQGLLG